jgi:hypothetical protein
MFLCGKKNLNYLPEAFAAWRLCAPNPSAEEDFFLLAKTQRPIDYPAFAGPNQLMLKNLKQKKELHFCNSFLHYEPLAGIEPATY